LVPSRAGVGVTPDAPSSVSPADGGAPRASGRDGAHRNPHRSTASAENPPGPSSMRNPKARGSTSAS
jgi:hypothetical protein